MTGFLGKEPLTSDIGLILEIIVIIALLVGRFKFARQKKFAAHGRVMALTVALHAVSVLLIMVPSLGVSWDLFIENYSTPSVLITWIHVPLGALALILGAYLVLSWRFRSVNETCYKRAKLMRPLWLLWLVSLLIGLYVFATIAFY